MPQLNIDRYVVIHVATTCDEHGVYVTKDSAEVIELGWILLDATSLEQVSIPVLLHRNPFTVPILQLIRALLTLLFILIDHPRERSRKTCQHSHHSTVQ